MQIVRIIFILVLGLVFGSFLSAFTFRLPLKINFIKGRSFCPKCKNKISWFDNIPLFSFIFLKGKCRNCKKIISLRYPLIEVFSAMFFLLIYVKTYPDIFSLVFYLILFLISFSIFVIDLENEIIPDELIFLGYVLSFFYILLFRNEIVFEQILLGLLISLVMLFIHLVTKGKGMGLGDVKFTLFPATLFIFPQNIIWFFLSFILGSIVGIILILLKKAKFGKHIPFGPFLTLSFIVILLWGDNIVKLLGI